MINKLTSIAAAILVAATPSLARVETGTKDLINTVADAGIHVEIDSQSCIDEPGHHGWYRFAGMKRQLVLCPGDEVTAIDHDTVRHEVFHAIQHCVNAGRGTAINMPINQDHAKLIENAEYVLPGKTIQWIKNSYPEKDWLIEMEANLAAEIFTAEQLEELFRNACVY